MEDTAAHCSHCAGGALHGEQARALLADVAGWELTDDGKAMVKKLIFKNFADALAYVNKAGALAEEANHHPDFTLGWGYVTLLLTTHDAGGLTKSDFIMAQKLDAVV